MDKIVIELRVPKEGPEELTLEGLFRKLQRICREERRLRKMMRALHLYQQHPEEHNELDDLEEDLEEVLYGED